MILTEQDDITAKRLEQLAVERHVNAISGIQLSRCTKASDWPNGYRVIDMKTKKQLVFADGANKNDVNEVVAHIQGIIWRHDLPPFPNQPITANRAKYLRQNVSLTGLGSPTFEKALKGILDIYSLFRGHVPREKLKPCSCIDSYGEYTSIESSCRYFSSIKDCGPKEKHIPFGSEIDPYGILSSIENTSYVHIYDNVVQYYERSTSDTGEMRYTDISPVRFQIGDIVEAQVTLTLVSVARNEYMLVSILRSLTMLDNSEFSQKAFAAQAASKLVTNMKATEKQSIKRKIGYYDEERASIRLNFREMVIDDDMQRRATEGGDHERE
ncbi:hypothetical protein F5887DRAFT_1079945 [Amanita rubescens]|nr:hypothetical protein F5887DRAFT_1079945 [Amanita rubescens]